MLLLPLLFCCALQRSCGAAGDTNPRGRPEDRTWLLACGPCWLCLMSLGPIGIAIKALRSESGAKWGCCGCRLPDRKLALYGKGGLGGRGRTEEAAVAVADFTSVRPCWNARRPYWLD